MERIDKVVEAFNRHGFLAEKFADMNQAKTALLKLIRPEETVGLGASMNVKEGGVLDALVGRGQTLFTNMTGPDRTPQETDAMRRDAMVADWYLASSNAVTEQGELINIDGVGNRVAGLIFGPKKVVVMVGQNKITKNFADGMKRIKSEACGKNARRLSRATPCALDDRCHDCDSPHRMCNTVTWVQRPNSWHTEFHVYIIEEDWGY